MVSRGNTMQRGDLAEALFIAAAIRRGYICSKPCTVNTPYDVVVGGASRWLRRVQVKSAWVTGWRAGYVVKGASLSTSLYTKNEIDLLAAYVAPEDAWYLIPVAALPPKSQIYLFPHDPARDQRWRRYCEAWCLLGRPRMPPLPAPHCVLRRKFLARNLARTAY